MTSGGGGDAAPGGGGDAATGGGGDAATGGGGAAATGGGGDAATGGGEGEISDSAGAAVSGMGEEAGGVTSGGGEDLSSGEREHAPRTTTARMTNAVFIAPPLARKCLTKLRKRAELRAQAPPIAAPVLDPPSDYASIWIPL
jgi:hypothetical protein